jgi:ribosomal protein S18 acetylase RimI-like enzyme
MSSVLPAGLPAQYTHEPATIANAAEVFDVYAAEMLSAFGFCPDTIEDVRSWLEPSPETRTTQTLVRDGHGDMAQWWVALKEPGDPVFYAWISSHPRLSAQEHDLLSASGWVTLLDWVAQTAPANADEVITVQSFCPAGWERSRRHLVAAGFTRRRTFWEMTGPVTDAARISPSVPGLTITAPADPRVLHAVLNKALQGHWGFTPVSFDDWMEVLPSTPGYDPSLWYLAEIDGVAAAGMILSRRVQEDDALYVQELATLEEFRRRGIASALLATAFQQAANENLSRLSLHVDSENSHDAPALYRNAGLHERCAFDAYERELLQRSRARSPSGSG